MLRRRPPARRGLEPSVPFWDSDEASLAGRLRSPAEGLDDAEAEARLASEGPNTLRPKRAHGPVFELFRHFGDPLVLVLVAASAIAAVLGDRASFVIVTVVVTLSVLLDFLQEHRAQRAAELLAATVSPRARVRRGGRVREVLVSDVVPGDRLELQAGDLVPADALLTEARDAFVNESLLTGEPYPVEKEAAGGDPKRRALFAGTSLVSGFARALVVRTGTTTTLGEVAQGLVAARPPGSFELGARHFGFLIMRLTAALVLFVVFANLLLQRPILESFLFAVALAVGLTPELLPMIVTVSLARGSIRMGAEHVVIKRLAAIEDLGAMNVLCTDKTGTLTEAHISLVRWCDGAGEASPHVLELAVLNSRFESGLRSPLDEAILEHGAGLAQQWTKVDEVPFDFERRRVSVLADDGKTRLVVVKGAPDDVLALSAACEIGGKTVPLDEAGRARLRALVAQFGTEGFRVLGVAWREVERTRAHASVADEAQLVFAGLAAFLDPPRTDAKGALEELDHAGIAVKIVTGDSDLVTRHLCRELGLAVTGVVLGPEVDALDGPALVSRVRDANLFCRMTPAQKARVIAALRRGGAVVGYLGDGINDAPSLRAADVGISVDSAVEVARAAADVILLRHDLRVLARGVEEGRRTFANVRKYLLMATSSNFGNMCSMALATVVLPFLPMLPAQVLLNNLLYDFSELALPGDRVDREELQVAQTWNLKHLLRFMLIAGGVSSLFDFVTFAMLRLVFHADAELFRAGWFVESLATQGLVIFVIRSSKPLRSRPAPALVAATLTAVAVAFVLPFTRLGGWLGFEPLTGAMVAVILATTAVYLLTVALIARALRLREPPPIAGTRIAAVP